MQGRWKWLNGCSRYETSRPNMANWAESAKDKRAGKYAGKISSFSRALGPSLETIAISR